MADKVTFKQGEDDSTLVQVETKTTEMSWTYEEITAKIAEYENALKSLEAEKALWDARLKKANELGLKSKEE
jgi:hypothetical protein